MGRLWTHIETAAAGEFGRRHYRGVIALRVARVSAAPVLLTLAGLAAAAAVVRWGIPAIRHGMPVAAHWSLNLVPALIVIGLAVVVVPAALLAWRAWSWRLAYRAPWLTGRLVAASGGTLFALTVALTVWPR
jgi:hypothetical protein